MGFGVGPLCMVANLLLLWSAAAAASDPCYHFCYSVNKVSFYFKNEEAEDLHVSFPFFKKKK